MVAAGRGRELRFVAQAPGAYRAEADIDAPFDVPWLLANAIYLGRPEAAAVATSAAPPAPTEPPARPPLSIRDGLRPEGGPSAAVELLPAGDAGGALVARFRLAAPGLPPSWCALVDRTARDLDGYRALTVAGSASAELRLDVGITFGEQRFRRSIRLGPEPRSFRLPLGSFHGGAGGRERPPAQRRAENVVLAIGPDNARPGASGELRLTTVTLE